MTSGPGSAPVNGRRTLVHVLRHGEVDNPGKVLYGRLPGYHLSELGRRMAERVTESLAGRDVVQLISSPLERARETAEPVAEKFGLPLTIDDRLIEAGNVFEGLTFGVGDGSLRKPSSWKHLWNPFRPSWGEPYRSIVVRMLGVIADARKVAAGHEALLISHQLPIWTVRSYLEGRRLWHDPRKRQCTLASLTTFSYDADQLVAVDYSEPAADLLPVGTPRKFVAGA